MAHPTRLQRIGAYGVVLHNQQILLTQISPSGFPAGAWALPGGRIEHGEDPLTALYREVYEETGLEVLGASLRDVHSVHTVGDGREGAIEDYHGIHLLYDIEIDFAQQPRVIETNGSCAEVRWVPIDEAFGLDSLPTVGHVLRTWR